MSTSSFHTDTLIQGLQYLSQNVREWCKGTKNWKPEAEEAVHLHSLASDLDRQVSAWMAERPFLTIVLMGGTGVGKSTLLNALAKSTIAAAAVSRPTTTEPVVYLHDRLDVARLAPELRQCRIIRHDRSELENKVLVDTPDLDSNATIHRDRLQAVLPLADVVLYVGSQEKYHDEEGWKIFRQHRTRRAFAFVLNKWDRCYQPTAAGVRPDEDLKRDLEAEGFPSPLIFRTCAGLWAGANGTPVGLPPDEQFPVLEKWIQQGLTKQEIASIHARGIVRTFEETIRTLEKVQPTDTAKTIEKLKVQWDISVKTESTTMAQALVGAMDPDQRKVEAGWSLQNSFPLRGFFGGTVKLIDFVTRIGSGSPWQALPAVTGVSETTTPARTDFYGQAQNWAEVAWKQLVETHVKSLPDRLLSQSSEIRWPRNVVEPGLNAVFANTQQSFFATRLTEALAEVGRSFTDPQSWRNRLGKVWSWLGNGLPVLTVGATFAWLVYGYFVNQRPFFVSDLMLPFILGLLVLLILYWVYRSVMRVRWKSIRTRCVTQLASNIAINLKTQLEPVLEASSKEIMQHRETADSMMSAMKSSSRWIAEQEQASKVAVLYTG